MPRSPRSSHASGTCRPQGDAFAGKLEWRPSPLLGALLILLGLLAACAVLASEMPRAAAWCVAAAALLHAVRLAARECDRPPVAVACDLQAGIRSVGGAPVHAAQVHWRGPLAFLHWRDARGRAHRLAFWPDVLDGEGRRALRLAAGPADAAGTRSPAGGASDHGVGQPGDRASS